MKSEKSKLIRNVGWYIFVVVSIITGCGVAQTFSAGISVEKTDIGKCIDQKIFKEVIYYGDDYSSEGEVTSRLIMGNKYYFFIGRSTHSGILGVDDFYQERFDLTPSYSKFSYQDAEFNVLLSINGRVFHEIKRESLVVGYYNVDSSDFKAVEDCFQKLINGNKITN